MTAPVVAVHSTVAPSTPAELEALGVRVLDAPVSGGPMGAADGTLAIMVGGDEAAYAVAEPVLQRMGSKVVHAGPLGAGTKMKLARNLIHFVAFTAVTEAQRLAEASGLDLVAARRGGPPHRRDHRRAGRDHAPRHHGEARPRRLLARRLRATSGRWGRRTCRSRSSWPGHWASTYPSRSSRARTSRKGWGCRWASSTISPRSAAAAWRRWSRSTASRCPTATGDFFRYTADHLFADIWSRPGLSDRDRRLLLIGLLAGTGAHDVLTIQVPAALASGDLDEAALREIVVFLCHYAGWPNGARLNSLVEETIAKAARDQ